MSELAIMIGLVHIAAAIALLNGLLTTFGQAKVVSQAIESIARQPESAADIRQTMFIGVALSETSGIYGLLIAIVMLFANPLVNRMFDLIG